MSEIVRTKIMVFHFQFHQKQDQMRWVYATTTGLKTVVLQILALVTVLQTQWSPTPQPDREADLWLQGNVLAATSQLFLDHAVGLLELGPGIEFVDGWVWEDGDVRDVTLTVIVDRVCGRGKIHGLLEGTWGSVANRPSLTLQVYQASLTFMEGERWSGQERIRTG